MNLETVKTIVLTLLVGFSLLLTFSLWNSQPNLDYISNHPEYVSEVDIGGREENKQELIQPGLIIFHKNDQFYGLTDPLERLNIYDQILDWELDHFQTREVGRIPEHSEHVEIIFPTSLPIEVIKYLFETNESDQLPNWSFKRIFITFNQANSWLRVMFLSVDGTQIVEYVVKNTNAYNYLRSYANFEHQLDEYIQFDEGREPIYLPAENVKMKNRSITIQTIDSYLLVNALFANPSNVRPNIGEASFSDGQRGMQILNDGRSIEFINPIHSNGEFMSPLLLLERSLEKINEHKGWTNDFVLVDIDILNHAIYYRMQYEGYPVFSRMRDHDVALIELRFLNQELHLYKRPLFKLDNLLGGESIELPAGREVIDFLKVSEHYDQTKVTDIQIGYKIVYVEGTSYSLTLEPAWFMKYRGNWVELRIDDYDFY